MSVHHIDSAIFIKMVQMGATNLSNHRDIINKLNVFPVPDGDTGTNMNLSMTSGVKEMNAIKNEELQAILSAFVRGLLMGARGNSGVILSQLFRGFSSSLKQAREINSQSFAEALHAGVDTAYQSVTTPVEGTILTVAKDAAKRAMEDANTKNIIKLMENVVLEAKQSLKRTPELLPILKEVGVVDSGGKGLVVIYEGFLAALKGEELPKEIAEVDMETMVQLEHEQAIQSFTSADSIEYGYCTEFFVEIDSVKQGNRAFEQNNFRNELSEYGDSLLVAADNDLVKVHIHTENPGKVMNLAQTYGQLVNIDIENMRKQYESIVKENEEETIDEEQTYGIIAVAFGSGLKKMFTSLGTTLVIEGGQTMNPSTEDLLVAIDKVNAAHTFILPNNKNILMAANQAKALSTKDVTIIPTKTIPQGISVLFSFDEHITKEDNEKAMVEAMQSVKTGLVTFATRNTVINQMEIKKDFYMGLNDETILVTNSDKLETAQALLEELIDDDDEIVTIFYGEDVTEEELASLHQYTQQHIEDVEIEFHEGNQPIYSFILMIE